MTRPSPHIEKETAVTSWDAFFAGPKKVLPKGIDFDDLLEASNRE